MNKLLASVALVAMAGTAHAQSMGSGNTYDPARDEIGVSRDGTFEGYVTLGSYDDYWASQTEVDAVAAASTANTATLGTLDPSAFAADGDTTADAFTSTGGTVVNAGTPDALDLDVSPAIVQGAADGVTALSGQAAQDLAIAAAQADADAAQAKADANALEIAAHIPSSVTNNGDGTCTHDNGDGVTTDYYCVGLLANDDVYAAPELPLREPSIIAPLSGDFIAAGLASQAISNRADVTVTVNPDGTHTVTPAASACVAGGWSYDYTVTDADGNTDTATVTGIVDNTPVEKLRTVTNTTGTLHNLALVLANGGTYDVDWGDGNVSAGNTSSATVFTENTYSADYTGPIVATAPACEDITQIRMTQGDYTGEISALLRQVPKLQLLVLTGANEGSGDLSSALTYVPELRYFDWRGQNEGSGDLSSALAYVPDLETFIWTGNNDGSGDLSSALTYVPELKTFIWTGANEGSGDLSSALAYVPELDFFIWQGLNIGTYSTTTWPTSQNFRLFRWHGQPKSTADVDNALAALTNVTSWASEKTVDLEGTNAPPSATGNAAIPTIIANGAAVVNTN